MAKLEFNDLSFRETKGGLEVTLMGNYSFTINKDGLMKIGSFSVGKDGKSIEFKDINEKKASPKFNFLIANNIGNLKNRLNGRPAIYIHQNSGIPLIGTVYFGIVDKGSDMIEIKPLSCCNLNCVFCSVGEGVYSKKEADYIVEEDYLVAELKALLDYKKHEGMKIFINPHGEPLLYNNIVSLVGRIAKLKHIGMVAIITNGVLLDKKLIDKLADAGLTQINLSMNAIDSSKTKMLSGMKDYNIESLKRSAEYAAKKLKLVIAPVWIKGLNDAEIEKIIEFAKKINAETGIQKFIGHKKGKKPIEEVEWDEFYSQLDSWQEKHGSRLRGEFEPVKTRELPMPFKKNDIFEAEIVAPGRNQHEMIAASMRRSIVVFGCDGKVGETIKIRLIEAKHNIFVGKEN